jgi:hypothetical protein
VINQNADDTDGLTSRDVMTMTLAEFPAALIGLGPSNRR